MAESAVLVDVPIDVDSSSSLSTEDLSNNTDVIDRIDQQEDNNNEGISSEINGERETLVGNNISQPTDSQVLIKINEIDSNIDRPWKVHGTITFKHPKRTYVNANGNSEISTWDFSDETSSINIVAFNLHSNLMSNQLFEAHSYEISYLTIRPADPMYKNLPHDFVLTVNNSTVVRDIEMNFQYQSTYNFVDLNEIESLPLNSLIDVNVKVLRDYGLSTGYSNDNMWNRRDLHVAQGRTQTRPTLWNDLAKKATTSMVNKELKIKNVKVSWFGGSPNLVSLSNTQLQII